MIPKISAIPHVHGGLQQLTMSVFLSTLDLAVLESLVLGRWHVHYFGLKTFVLILFHMCNPSKCPYLRSYFSKNYL